jgi:hypothetical protein
MTQVTETTSYFRNKLVEVQFVAGNSKSTMPLLVAVMEGVLPRCAGLGGVNDGSLSANATNFKSSGVFGRVYHHAMDEFRGQALKKIITIDHEDQETVLRDQGNGHRHK